MPHDTALHRFGAALQSAARRYGTRLAEHEAAGLDVSEARSALARFGLPAGLVPDRNTPPLADTERTAALRRLHAEHRRLARLARVRHPAYDLNRHIALRRLLRCATPEAPRPIQDDARETARIGANTAQSTRSPRVLNHTTSARIAPLDDACTS